jgi:hypothetical protein
MAVPFVPRLFIFRLLRVEGVSFSSCLPIVLVGQVVCVLVIFILDLSNSYTQKKQAHKYIVRNEACLFATKINVVLLREAARI